MPGQNRAHGQQETAKGYRRTRVTEVSGTACYFTVSSTLLVFANRFFVFTRFMGSAKVVHSRACPPCNRMIYILPHSDARDFLWPARDDVVVLVCF